MITWFAFIIPVLLCLFILFTKKEKLEWWYFVVPLVFALIIITGFKFASNASQTTDVEYWGGYITEARYDEPWDEEVSCQHPIYQTTYYECGSKDSPMQCSSQTLVGYEHSYDVDEHPPHWYFIDSMGDKTSIDSGYYDYLVKEFDNKKFVDLHRNFHSKDGDRYVSVWPNKKETLKPITANHTYINKVQASNSIFKFPKISDKDVKFYSLYSYPQISSYGESPSILGYADSKGEKELSYLNATLGARYQVRVFVLVFQNQPMEASFKQEAYWMGGNKNEIIICVGTDKENKVKWSRVFSWCEIQKIKVETNNEVLNQLNNKLQIEPIALYLEKEIPAHYKRKQFADFDYLTVDEPYWSILSTYSILLVASIGWLIYIFDFFSNNRPRY